MVFNLSPEEQERYSRQLVLDDIGFEGQKRLKESTFCIIGVGGLGNHIAMLLASMGVGRLRLVDRDVVELSNLHRQPLYTEDQLGLPKVEAAEERLKSINPRVEVEPIPIGIDGFNAERLLKGCDVVVDGLDSIEARYAVNAAAIRLGIPYVYGSAIQMMGSIMTILPDKTPCLQCLFPNLRDEELPKCGVEGVHPAILMLVSSLEVSEAVKLAIGAEPSLAGQLLLIDLRDTTFDTVALKRSEGCRACSKEMVPQGPRLLEDLCGREGKRALVLTPQEDLHLPLGTLLDALERRGVKVIKRGRLGITLRHTGDVTLSILSSGITIMVGINSEQEALRVYEELVLKPLSIPWSRVGEEALKLLAKSP